MLRTLLHWTTLAAAIALWLLAARGVRKEDEGRMPQAIARSIQADLSERSLQSAALDRHSADVLQWMGAADAGDDSAWVARQPYELFAFRGDSLIAWSTAAALPPAQMNETGRIYQLNSGTYYGYLRRFSWLPGGVSLAILFPIAQQYPFYNEYLQPCFAASEAIDPHMVVADAPTAGAAPLIAPDGRRIGWVQPPPVGDLPEPPANRIVWCWLLSLVALATWLQGWASALARRGRWGRGAALVVCSAVVIRLLLLHFGPPFRISETELFSPRLYASSSRLPSLGDLLLYVLGVAWCLLFIAPRIQLVPTKASPAMRWLAAVLCGCSLFGAGILFIRVIRSLVLDSLIAFDSSHLSALTGSSMTGLLIAILLLSILLIIAGVLRNALRNVLPSFGSQAGALLIGAFLLWLLFRQDLLLAFYGIAALWLSIDVLGQQVTRLRGGAGLFRVGNIFRSVGHCLLLAMLLQHYGRVREGETRRAFAEHIATRHDDAMEYNFGQSLTLVRTDTALQQFMRRPNPVLRKALEERLAALYFNNTLAAYQAQVYLFNADGKPVLNRDTTSLDALQKISRESIPSRTATDLYYREAATDDHIYLALMDLADSAGNMLGAMGIDLEQKKIVSETVLPELLQPATINQAEKAAGYAYAIYAGGRLVAQTSDYPFPFYVPHDPARATYHERKGNDFSTLIYTPDAYRSVYVWRRFGTLPEVLTLFSYLLLLRLILLAAGSAYRHSGHWLSHPDEAIRSLRGIGLRRRLQLSIMGIVAVSFIAIGIATVLFLRQQYDSSGKTRRQAMMQVVVRALQQWIKERDSDNDPAQWQKAISSPDFRYFLAGLAASQKIDINLFDADGHLSSTTQPAIYDQKLLAPVMRYEVLRYFAPQPRSLTTQIESIGALRYQSCYAPLRAEDGAIAAYVNVPLFYAQRELDEQISSVMVTLVNLYAVALLLSGLLAYFTTRWVTRAFDVIIRQFGRLSLHRNDLLQWPYDDEVGMLVAEYNKMARKVEESAALLAQNEREGAFREMARQVAHEIKNPLTPMNLYVQRLQRAIRAGEPDVVALAGRVSEALLEQINNLSAIATEFGAFARIGTARPEAVELSAVLRNVTEPFTANGKAQLSYEAPEGTVYVMADRSGLVRIFTNLLQNAVQAIPEGAAGVISVQLTTEAGHAHIRIRDNGAGISPEAQEKLFTPYFTTKSSGTGLGLAMTRQMLEAWGGAISYETAPGAGTTFLVRMPATEAEPDPDKP